MHRSRHPLYLRVAFFALVLAGVPLVEEETSLLATVQYLFSATVIVTYFPVGIVALYHLLFDPSQADSGVVNSIYLVSLLIWAPILGSIACLILRRKKVAELFKRMVENEEALQKETTKRGKTGLVVFASFLSLVYSFSHVEELLVDLNIYQKRLGLGSLWGGVFAMIAFFPITFFWCSLNYSINIMSVLKLHLLEVLNQKVFATCQKLTQPHVLPVVYDYHGTPKMAEEDDPTSIRRISSINLASYQFQKDPYSRIFKLKKLTASINQVCYIPCVTIMIISIYCFLSAGSFADTGFTVNKALSFLLAILLATSFPLSFCGFSVWYSAKSRKFTTMIKRTIYTSSDVRERRVLSLVTSCSADKYSNCACIFFDFDFILLGTVVEIMCLVITAMYIGRPM